MTLVRPELAERLHRWREAIASIFAISGASSG